ncbi:MAG: glycosyltransferase [Methanobrevibacter thaueri]|nr:glycosyltransferase [Methanobrevibacter thaueri]
MKISIVIHSYNMLPNEFIKLQESLINQTFGFHNIQIIIVDNGSVISESKNLILEFERIYDNVDIILFDKHCNDYDAYKIGLSKVKTNYVILFNSRDVLYSNSCELLYNAVNESNAEVVVGNYYSLKNKSNLDEYFSNDCLFSDNNIDYNVLNIDFALGSRIYKKELLDDIFSINEIESWAYFNFETLINAKSVKIINNMIIQLNGDIKNNSIFNLDKLLILNKLIKEEYSDLTIAIKTPNLSKDKHWGDYFYSIALKKAFEKKGFNVIIHEREFWNSDDNADIVVVLRGVVEYSPKSNHINIMWNISHPADVSIDEYENFDFVFIASEKFANEINNKTNVLVKPLLQCTDPEVFYYIDNEKFNDELLFVGVTRGIFREIVKDINKTNHNFSVYGYGWDRYINKKFIKGDFIPNNILNQAYSSCKILLNDHWEDMKDNDFPSNRLFDALACGTFVISDNIESSNILFEGNIINYTDFKDLNKKVEYYLTHDDKRKSIANVGREIVLKYHTFDNRVDEILEILKNYNYNRFLIK